MERGRGEESRRVRRRRTSSSAQHHHISPYLPISPHISPHLEQRAARDGRQLDAALAEADVGWEEGEAV